MKKVIIACVWVIFGISVCEFSHADDVLLEMSWGPVSKANAYKAQYNINGGSWRYIDTIETSATFSLDLIDGDVVKGLVRGCFELNTSCSEGDFSNSSSVTYMRDERIPAPQNFQLRIVK